MYVPFSAGRNGVLRSITKALRLVAAEFIDSSNAFAARAMICSVGNSMAHS